eukprot:gb/GECH01014426.1/.p1 GENE.gb/GECH01014426.1/~~gb/GECH01014426.1/.p1  ORF type:complete len:413 (+),score=108.39 gb/GECH01014426.1/:1-1239(+)
MDLSSVISGTQLERLGFVSKTANNATLQRMSQYSMSQVDLSQMDLTQGGEDGFDFSQTELSQLEGGGEMDMSLDMGDGSTSTPTPHTASERSPQPDNVNLSDLLGRVLILGHPKLEYSADEDVEFLVSINLPNLNHILSERKMTAAPIKYNNLKFALTSARESEPPELEIPDSIEEQEKAFPHTFDNNECSTTVKNRFSHGPQAVMWAIFKVDGVSELLYLRTRSSVKVSEYRLALFHQRDQLVKFAEEQNKHISKVIFDLLGEDMFRQCFEKHDRIEITKVHPSQGSLSGNQPIHFRLRCGIAMELTEENTEIYFGNQQVTDLKLKKYNMKKEDETSSSSSSSSKHFYKFYQATCRTPPFPEEGTAELTVLHKGIFTSAVSSFYYTASPGNAGNKRKLEDPSNANKRRKVE